MIVDAYKSIRQNSILNQRFCDRGIAPDPDQLEAIAQQIAAQAPGTQGSLLPGFQQIEGQESSASLFMQEVKSFVEEIRVLRKALNSIETTSKIFFDRAENRLSMLSQQASQTMLSACALQTARRSGNFLVAVDSLSNLSQVNQSHTSADVDLSTGMAKLKKQPAYQRYDLTLIRDNDIDLSLIQGSMVGFSMAPGSHLAAPMEDTDSFWLQRVLSETDEVKTLGYQVDLKQVWRSSRLTFQPLADDREGSFLIRVLGSSDGVNWLELQPKSRSTCQTVIVDFEPMDLRHLRLEMTVEKANYQTTDSTPLFVFNFGLKNFRLYQTKYYPVSEFVTKPIFFLDNFGNPNRINRLLLETYSDRPIGTEITYFVATDPNNLAAAQSIFPGQELVLDDCDEVAVGAKVKQRFDNQHALLDLQLPVDPAGSSQLVPGSLRFFRNVFQKDVLIDGIQAGWGVKDQEYHCVFRNDSTLEIDLGKHSAFLDGLKVNGIQIVAPGYHTFRTPETNWAPTSSDASDPLYPHNHRFLIEGLSGSSVYRGVDFLAASELKLVSAFDLLNNINSDQRYTYFALYQGFPLVKVSRPPVTNSIEGWRSERYSITYRITGPSTGYEQIVLIARLTTQNSYFSPVLRGWMIAAGN